MKKKTDMQKPSQNEQEGGWVCSLKLVCYLLWGDRHSVLGFREVLSACAMVVSSGQGMDMGLGTSSCGNLR